jgi:hypothetical protein
MSIELPTRCRSFHRESLIARRASGKADEYIAIRQYNKLLQNYKLLCRDCNLEGRSIRNHVWLERFQNFLDHLRSQIIPLMQDTEFSESVRNLLCTIRCQNIQHWPENLNRTFFNWMCHRTAYVGYDILNVNPQAFNGFGNCDPETLVQSVRNVVDIGASSARRDQLETAQNAFSLAYMARVTRHPLNLEEVSVCSELGNSGHEYQQRLMYVLMQVSQEYLRAAT